MTHAVPASPVPPRSHAPRPALDGPVRILVVDDVADNRDILTRRLRRRGFEVTEAENGREAIDLVAGCDFDMILLDIMMPDILGTEVVREIRKTYSASELPIIMVSAKSQSEDVAESLELGANDYVIKPVDFTVALARIQSHLDRAAEAARERESTRAAEREALRFEAAVTDSIAEFDRTRETLLRELSARKCSEDRLEYIAYHDDLTDISNRAGLFLALREAWDDREMRARDFVLLFIDLDRFKAVNDVHGHAIGDEVLREIARRLEEVTRDEAFCLARLGGDEFAVLFPADNDPEAGNRMGRRIIETLSRPVTVDRLTMQIGASCGAAFASACGAEADLMIKAADLAMYDAKGRGRGRVSTFDMALMEERRQRSSLEISLFEAIKRNEFELYYQPLIDTQTHRVICLEALVRWNHPERGLLLPAAFIPVAEETGLINELGAWIIETACTAALTWPDHLRVAVNLSAQQFNQPDLVETIHNAVEKVGLDPRRLELEITESCLLEAVERNVAVLTRIRAMGIRVVIDDFGVGYSSMSYLQKFVFDKLKIDRRFVSDIGENPKTGAIVNAIVGLGTQIGTSTTVEGVETMVQLEAVLSHGCQEIQGFLFSKPLPAAQALAFAKAQTTFDYDRLSGVSDET